MVDGYIFPQDEIEIKEVVTRIDAQYQKLLAKLDEIKDLIEKRRKEAGEEDTSSALKDI